MIVWIEFIVSSIKFWCYRAAWMYHHVSILLLVHIAKRHLHREEQIVEEINKLGNELNSMGK